jgi:hypothetical protein
LGHERIGFLPKNQSWNHIVDQLSSFDGNVKQIYQIADQTLTKIQSTYKLMPYDESVIRSIKYLIILSCSAKNQNQTEVLKNNGINIDKISLYTLAHGAKDFVKTDGGSLESNQISRDALLETIAKYENSKQNDQLSLFGSHSENIWSEVGSGAAFCELARGFFASFTDRYLRYYLEREAAHTINDYKAINDFSRILSEQTERISSHAFETSKLVQSFSAGWFNKYTATNIPNEEEIKGFLRHSFDKMREEFRREAEKE